MKISVYFVRAKKSTTCLFVYVLRVYRLVVGHRCHLFWLMAFEALLDVIPFEIRFRAENINQN